jgi:hypothetical protein
MRVRPTMQKTLFFFLILIQIGCSFKQAKTDVANFPVRPLIVSDDKEDGWGGDVRLSITNISENDSAKILKAVSAYNNKDLGLLVFIPKAALDNKGFGKSIILKSIGDKSDNLLNALTVLYKQKAIPGVKFTASISGTFVDLSEFAKSVTGSSSNTDPGISEYKLFFEGKDDEAELFLNINTSEHWLELREKDPEYRPLIIKMLTK